VLRIMTVYGTRPEAIKVAPVLAALDADRDMSSLPVVTGQHREMLDQVNDFFGIEPIVDLDVFKHAQTLSELAARILERSDEVLMRFRPDAVVVQGDTTTSMAAAIGAFYRRIPVFHLEAGLRSGNIDSPFPEELNRQVTSRMAALHFAPTHESQLNLIGEGIAADSVAVTGNTVIDALLETVAMGRETENVAVREAIESGRRVLLTTMHRRESWGQRMSGVARAIRQISDAHPDVQVVLPIHRNPIVREAVLPHLRDASNVLITEPLSYLDFANVLSASHLVLTDSGGVQEEAPSLGKPVLVMRENTERPEAVVAGTVKLVGTDHDRIVREVDVLLTDNDAYGAMSHAVNPYGDGRASGRVLGAIREYFGIGLRLPDFTPVMGATASS